MRKNVKKQLALRVLSTAALMAMVSSIATAAFAEEYDLNKGSVTVETKDNGNTYVTQANTETTDHLDTTGVTITSNGEQTSNTITVETAKDQTTNVTLQDVNIKEDQWSGGAAMTIKGDGDTEIELNGSNILSSGNGHAGLEKADDVSHGSLTIKDDVDDLGQKKEEGQSGDVGSLNTSGGYGGAGIGGRVKKNGDNDTCQDTSKITITGGCIKAGALNDNYKSETDMYNGGAGIGGASDGACGGGNANYITITGNADVTAGGGYYAAAIGGGDHSNGSNITISGNAKVTAAGSLSGSAGIGGGDYGMGKDILITDNADVTAYGGNQGAGIGGGYGCGGSIAISGNATVTAVGNNGGAGIGSGGGTNTPIDKRDTTIVISDNATVTAVGSYGAAAIGNGMYYRSGNTNITITGGTVTAVAGKDGASAIGSGSSPSNNPANVTVTINGSTGKTIIDASCQGNSTGAIGNGVGKEDLISYDENAKSSLGEDGSVVVKMYNGGSFTTKKTSLNYWTNALSRYNLGTLYQTVHNRKYMEEHPEIVDDINKLENSDLHDWQLVGEVVEPTLEEDGYADYICRIDNCGQTRHVVLPKLTPEESGSVETREVGVIFWDAAAQAAPAALQGKVLSADEQTATAEKAQVESLLADKANWKLAEDVGDLKIHPAADAAGTVYEQAVKASGCQYYVIANVTAQ